MPDQKQLLEKLLTEPAGLISRWDLVYVQDRQLSIRRKGKAKAFRYMWRGRTVTDGEILERIRSLAIPPAWAGVVISELHNGHVQAAGRDKRNRKQYRYHPVWTRLRNQTKFLKLSEFGKKLPGIRKVVETDLDLEGWPRRKVLALSVRLMEETHIRVGSEAYARRNKTYGLATLRKRHVTISRERLIFTFTGKKGKVHKITLHNKKLRQLVSNCLEIPGWELFKFYGPKGDKQEIDSGMINDYIRELAGPLHSAKDFRTWAGSVVFLEAMLQLTTDPQIEPAEAVRQAFKEVSKALGNTPSVCRKYYVHPELVRRAKAGQIHSGLAPEFDSVKGLSPTESLMLELIGEYKPLLKPATSPDIKTNRA